MASSAYVVAEIKAAKEVTFTVQQSSHGNISVLSIR